jgi:ferredoxin
MEAGGEMRVLVDRTLCQGHGQCAVVAPDVFDLDDDGVMHCLEHPDPIHRAAVELAVRFCPEEALTLID